ncbi:MAG: ornithine--oxo-acid transaminase [Egibacteraceae bacterium]
MTTAHTLTESATSLLELEHRHAAHNYHPLPVVLAHGEGAWVTDVEGRRYLDLLSAYSALNFGHRHPALLAAARAQLDRLTLASRAFHTDQFARFAEELAGLAGKDAILPMNTGAEAVETAIKVARKWGYERKRVPTDMAEIVVCHDNFHGRTTTIVGFSDDPEARTGFGPFATGFVHVPHGDAEALAAAITDRTVAFLFEPIQGEAGVIVPPDGWLRDVRRLCNDHNVLMIADEIQSGLGRAGATFACDHEQVTPDLYLLGKALGGGIVPVSAVVADWDVLGVIRPGEHGSTFGGNPLAAAVGSAVVELLQSGELQRRSARLGANVLDRLRAADLSGVAEIRGRGLWWALDLHPDHGTGRELSQRLLEGGVLAKDTRRHTVRFAPPLTIDEGDLDHALDVLEGALRNA